MNRKVLLLVLAVCPVVLLIGCGGGGGGDATPSPTPPPQTTIWSPTGAMETPRYGHTAILLGNGKVLIAGGSDASSYLSSAELYDPG